MLKYKKNSKGFTFIELLIVVAIIGILAAGAVALINPAKRFQENRNAKRSSDVAIILNAVHNYYIDNNGSFPSAIQEDANCLSPSTIAEICKKDIPSLTCISDSKIPLSQITENEKYLPNWPVDPTGESTNGIGYNIVKSANSRITVCAPYAEDTTISITR
ncbi:hypothetical protein C0580_03505 [Candidatus Parcubacteria bacterium]|nr:MAG: hypothetical protein C0580_03505 [Candidatus Parcubacteria bacterium]